MSHRCRLRASRSMSCHNTETRHNSPNYAIICCAIIEEAIERVRIISIGWRITHRPDREAQIADTERSLEP